MNSSLAHFIFLLLLGAMYLPVIFFAVQRREEGYGAATWLTVLYAVLAMVMNIAEATGHGATDTTSFLEFQTYIAITLAAILMLAFQSFLKRETWWLWAGFWVVWILGLGLILTNALNLPNLLWTNGSVALYRSRLGPAWAILGWLVLAISLILSLAGASRQTSQQHLRNRLNYWWPALFFMFISDILLFSGTNLSGQPFRLGAAITAAYVVGTHELPDLRQIMRRILAYLAIVITIVVFYIIGFLLVQVLFGNTANFNPLVAGAFISLLLAIIFAPLSGVITRTVNRWMKGDQYDASVTIHRYSENISNILDMDRLASISVSIILESMKIERGHLFLVDSERQTDGSKIYKLRSAASPEERQVVVIILEEQGAFAAHILREQRPLLQYDLDFLPAFRNAPPHERNWLSQLHSEVYIPVFAKRQWIGLFAFGSKLSGNRYNNDDLKTLSAHANQTAVALENARLVDNLMVLNTELRQARRALEKNNQDLERIDQAKSDFISIASHELRTPLTIIKGYTEMLMDDPSLADNLKKMMTGIHDGTLRLHEVMDSMFDIAQIDARSLKPHLQPVELGLLIKEVFIEQAGAFKDRQQTVEINLAPMPHVKADPNLLKKIFHHIIRNAAKFTPNHGKITITGHQFPAVINMPNGGIEIIISDTGVGVDPNLREVIFTKFYQPGELGKHSTSKTRFKGGGAGLGLALSKGIVEAHNGRIWVESPGYDEVNFPGSQFHVILPLSKMENGESLRMSGPVKMTSFEQPVRS